MTRDLNQCPYVMLMVTIVVMELFKFTFLIFEIFESFRSQLQQPILS